MPESAANQDKRKRHGENGYKTAHVKPSSSLFGFQCGKSKKVAIESCDEHANGKPIDSDSIRVDLVAIGKQIELLHKKERKINR